MNQKTHQQPNDVDASASTDCSPRRLRKVFCLRVRPDDSSEWSEVTEYSTRKARDADAAFARALGGFRTHSFDRYAK